MHARRNKGGLRDYGQGPAACKIIIRIMTIISLVVLL